MVQVSTRFSGSLGSPVTGLRFKCSKCRNRKTASRTVSIQVKLASYQCQHGHKLSYKCQNGHNLLSDQCQTNGHDLISYQCQHGHKLLSNQCQTNGHNLVSYQCKHGHKLLSNQCQTNGHNLSYQY